MVCASDLGCIHQDRTRKALDPDHRLWDLTGQTPPATARVVLDVLGAGRAHATGRPVTTAERVGVRLVVGACRVGWLEDEDPVGR
jgi:hypothetical protein